MKKKIIKKLIKQTKILNESVLLQTYLIEKNAKEIKKLANEMETPLLFGYETSPSCKCNKKPQLNTVTCDTNTTSVNNDVLTTNTNNEKENI